MASSERAPRLAATCIDGRYELLRELGQGGSAVVFDSWDRHLQRPVAFKRMRASWVHETSSGGERRQEHSDGGLEEARALARLRHPNLVEVYDAGRDEAGRPYVTMERLTGRTLEARLREGPLSPAEALAHALPVLGALAVAHDSGIVHRDVKPSNIFLEARAPGQPARPVLLDFGVASDAACGRVAAQSFGTPAYMAPECARREPVGKAADVWSMGVLLFRALSGALPFEAESAQATLARVASTPAPPLGHAAPDLPSPLALAIDKALRPRPHRYPHARAFARALLEAGLSAGVTLPDAPDPVGLPDWRAWVEHAQSSEVTANLDTPAGGHPAPEPSAGRQTAEPRGARAGRLRAVALAAVAGVGLVAGGIYWLRPASRPVRADAPVAAAERALPPPPDVSGAIPMPLFMVSVPQSADAPPERAPAATPPAPHATSKNEHPQRAPRAKAPRRAPRRRAKAKAAPQRATTPRRAAAATSAPPLPDIVTNWEL